MVSRLVTIFGLTAFSLTSQAQGVDRPSLAYLLRSAPVITSEDVQIVFELTNNGGEPLRILKWYTPLEGFGGSFLEVECDGQRLDYEGPLAKRGEPGASDYLVIDPGETVRAELHLSEAYQLPRNGNCSVMLVRPIAASRIETGLAGDNATSPEVDGNVLRLRLARQ